MNFRPTHLKKSLVVLGISSLMSSGLLAETFVTDQGHTEVMFGWNHAGVSTQNGQFTSASGTLEL